MDYEDEKKDKLNKLEKKLYSRKAPLIIDKGRTLLPDEQVSVSEDWQESKSSFGNAARRFANMTKNKHTFAKKFLGFSVGFFVLALLVAGFIFLGGNNLVSSKNVDIKVTGPISVGGGQENSFDISIVNENNTDLQGASLLIEYPTGSRSPNDLSKDLTRERFALETIKSGQSFNQNIKVLFFGEKETIKEVKLSLEYRVSNSSALFYKEKVFEVSISSAPVIVTPIYPKEVNSNQDISFVIEVASNSKDNIRDFLVNVEYPFGFIFQSASPNASFGNNIWRFSNLASGDKKTITLRGTVVGQDNEERVFRVNVGTASVDDERQIEVPLSSLTESIMVKKPFIGLSMLLDSKEEDVVAAEGGRDMRGEILLTNNLPSRLFNTTVSVSFKGGAYNKAGVVAESGGFFQSIDDRIVWDKRGVPVFADMAPGETERLSFRVSPLAYSQLGAGAKPEVEMTVVSEGERVLESGSVEKVRSTETKKIVLSTNLSLQARVVRSSGSFENSGPVPPRVDQKTTYTIIWTVSNSVNQVSNVEVRTTLPQYVKWTGFSNPKNESFLFNPSSSELVWNAGSILPGLGGTSSQKSVSFQVELLPSLSQLGQTPQLIGQSRLSATDKVTGMKIESSVLPVTTNFSGDPDYKMGDERVGQ